MTDHTSVRKTPRRRRMTGETRSRGVTVKMTPTAYETIRLAAEAHDMVLAAFVAEAALATAQAGTTFAFTEDHPARTFVQELDPVVRRVAEIHAACREVADTVERGDAEAATLLALTAAGTVRQTVAMLDRLVERLAA